MNPARKFWLLMAGWMCSTAAAIAFLYGKIWWLFSLSSLGAVCLGTAAAVVWEIRKADSLADAAAIPSAKRTRTQAPDWMIRPHVPQAQHSTRRGSR